MPKGGEEQRPNKCQKKQYKTELQMEMLANKIIGKNIVYYGRDRKALLATIISTFKLKLDF
jgi:hypothetical protein